MAKIIHYCWYGGKPIPTNLKSCMQTWSQLMPKYEIRRWDETSFDVNSTPWTKSAYEARKYAFVSDYVRLFALLNYGGIYLDTDVKLVKSLEYLQIQHPNTMGFESGNKLTSAIMMVEPHNLIIQEFINYYTGKVFTDDVVSCNEANVLMMTEILAKYGLKEDNTEQEVAGFHIYPRTYFCPLDFWYNKDFTENTHAIHYFDASWLNENTKKRIEKERGLAYKVKSAILYPLVKLKNLFL